MRRASGHRNAICFSLFIFFFLLTAGSPSGPGLSVGQDVAALPAEQPIRFGTAGDEDPIRLLAPALDEPTTPFRPDTRVDDDPGTSTQAEVSLAATSQGNWYAGWIDGRLGNWRCAFSLSTDGGASWSPNYLYLGPREECGDPVVVAGLNGEVYRLIMSFTRGATLDQSKSTLEVSGSSDGGASFGPWNTVTSTEVSGGLNDKPWMTVGPDNTLQITWTLITSSSHTLEYIRSDDAGTTWSLSSRQTLGTLGHGSCLATDASGNVYAGWSTPVFFSSIMFRKSVDGGRTFSPELKIADGGSYYGADPRSSPLPGCSVTPEGQHVYFTWAGVIGGNEDVYVVHSGDGGATWGPKVRVNDDGGAARQIMPWTDVDPKGSVHVAWTDFRNGVVEIFYARSEDLAQTWSPNARVNGATGPLVSWLGDYQAVAVDPSGAVGTAWTDTRSGNADIYFARTDPPADPLSLLRVTTSPAVPGKIIVDGAPRDEWGLAWMKIAPGTHLVSFGGLNGLGTPAVQTVTVSSGQTAVVQGNYASLGFLRVITNPAVASTISVNGVPRDDWGMWTALAPGTYTVHFGAVQGYNPPADQSATVNPGLTTIITGDFVPNPAAPGPDPATFGYLRVTTNPATAAQILVNGVPRDDWGLTWVKLPPGTYTVSFGQGYGYTPPAPKTVTVAAGATTTWDAPFVVHGSLRVTTSPALPATIFVNGVPRDDWGMWQSMPPGTYVVSFEAMPGYVTPAHQTVTVTSGTLTAVTGSYSPTPASPISAASGAGASGSVAASALPVVGVAVVGSISPKKRSLEETGIEDGRTMRGTSD